MPQPFFFALETPFFPHIFPLMHSDNGVLRSKMIYSQPRFVFASISAGGRMGGMFLIILMVEYPQSH